MPENALGSKVAKPESESKGDWPTASSRISPDDSRLLDSAAYKARCKRADVVLRGTLREVRRILNLPEAA